MKHPIVQQYIDQIEEMRARIGVVAADLDASAAELPVNCGWQESGSACACTGACHPPEYYAMMLAAHTLRQIIAGMR